MITYFALYHAALWRHRVLCRALGYHPRAHDRFVHHCYWWWL